MMISGILSPLISVTLTDHGLLFGLALFFFSTQYNAPSLVERFLLNFTSFLASSKIRERSSTPDPKPGSSTSFPKAHLCDL